ncbi:30S ribosomal protein S4 [Alkalibacter saccharofermentans]|jgi:small subunit ribosomal protein S4|uniref:Small ribosomal subunit protein uS4 n=1 Tax=Alkalibacter saccharofermentans DSM 14828 TaxID=1120975 RepID=A0A1M4Y9I5_9FIRM|nr:30S ribosomal protein S4 [Alkalibacter saccharofermentans]SHF02441.1 SSU ribosomal protein S4P [Alkalibacter saccharofermentans DSM 14828]
MARYTEASCRLCRREDMKLYLKGDKCYSNKCTMEKRAFAPGQHGQRRTKLSEYGIQLREKQKAKRIYGIMEKQFRKYFEMAAKKQGITGDNLLQLLELRLDNVVYRLGLAASRKEARQLVLHGHYSVNGKKVNIPSYQVSEGDLVQVVEKSRKSDKFKAIVESTSSKVTPKWLEADFEKLEGKVIALPARDDIDLNIEDHLIVELYSR